MPSPVAKDYVAFVLGLEAAFDIFNKIYWLKDPPWAQTKSLESSKNFEICQKDHI